jgi:phospholipase C
MAIQHIFVLMLENRSFDHLLAFSGIADLSGIDTSRTNPGADGSSIAMSDTAPDRSVCDPGHEFEDVDWQLYGALPGSGLRPIKLNGFADRGCPQAMQCAAPPLVPVLTHLAANFLVCDRWFSSMPGPTWPNRFFVHAGSSGGLANSPSDLASLGAMVWSKVSFSFEHGTVYEALTQAGRTWRIYHGDHFPQVCAIDSMPSVFVTEPDQFRKLDAFTTDTAKGDVADYTFIEPDYSILSSFRDGNSQHPSGALSAGEALLASVANAVMGSPNWENSMLIVVYDEHGGFYDQFPPPEGCVPPGDQSLNAEKAQGPNPPFTFDRYGIRVPAIVVSPRVQPGSVSHLVYDHASVIRTIFEVFTLPGQLTDRDGKANSLKPLTDNELAARPVAPLPTVSAPSAAAPISTVIAPTPQSLDGFVRIAAQVHHALLTYQSAGGLPSRELAAAINPADDLTYLPNLPQTSDPDAARAYIQHVADLMTAHRQRQRLGPTP